VDPRVRRVLWIVTFGVLAARLYTLGAARGFGLVARASLSITALSLAAWLAHVVFHELGHLSMARAMRFQVRSLRLGPLVFELVGPRRGVHGQWSLGGGVNSLPRGVADLSRRLRLVAMAGPVVTLVVTALAWWRWSLTGELISNPLGIFVAMGVLTLVTALLPGALLPERPDSGTDLEQVVQPRAVLAHWVNAAAVQALLEGETLARLHQEIEREFGWDRLLPQASGAVEPIELGYALACLDRGERTPAMTRLRSMAERFDDETPPWLRTDSFNQLGCLAALAGDVVLARTCLERVEETQSFEWYSQLLRGCLAKAGGETFSLETWRRGLETHPAKAVALAGNAWILRALEA